MVSVQILLRATVSAFSRRGEVLSEKGRQEGRKISRERNNEEGWRILRKMDGRTITP